VSGLILPFHNFQPQIAANAFIAPTAVVIGEVEIAEDCGIWFGCVLRGDGNVIRIGPRTNIQDGTVIHVNQEKDGGRGKNGFACNIGADVTVGHLALLHACTLEDGSFVGMKACVMDGAVVETRRHGGGGRAGNARQTRAQGGAVGRQPGEAHARPDADGSRDVPVDRRALCGASAGLSRDSGAVSGR
jgi:gamma-carbonic anhydrase